jgi:hypothetical protein
MGICSNMPKCPTVRTLAGASHMVAYWAIWTMQGMGVNERSVCEATFRERKEDVR